MNYQILRKIEAFSENYKTLLTSETLAFKEARSWDRSGAWYIGFHSLEVLLDIL